MSIISLILGVLELYVLYYIFDNYNLKTAVIVNCIYGIIVSIINNGFNIISILLGIIVMIIETVIFYKIYTSSNSFGKFFLLTILLDIAIILVLVIVSTMIAVGAGSNGILR